MRECQPDVRGSLPPAGGVMTHVRGSSTSPQSCNARVQRACTRLHASQTHVHRDWTRLHTNETHVSRDISVVYRQRRVQSADSKGEFACRGRAAQKHLTRAQGHLTSARRDIRFAAVHAPGARRQILRARRLVSCAEAAMQGYAEASLVRTRPKFARIEASPARTGRCPACASSTHGCAQASPR